MFCRFFVFSLNSALWVNVPSDYCLLAFESCNCITLFGFWLFAILLLNNSVWVIRWRHLGVRSSRWGSPRRCRTLLLLSCIWAPQALGVLFQLLWFKLFLVTSSLCVSLIQQRIPACTLYMYGLIYSKISVLQWLFDSRSFMLLSMKHGNSQLRSRIFDTITYIS